MGSSQGPVQPCQKHGVSFAQAATVLLDALALTVFDAAHSQAEERWFKIGTASCWRWRIRTKRAARWKKVRIISAREAIRRERQQYEEEPR